MTLPGSWTHPGLIGAHFMTFHVTFQSKTSVSPSREEITHKTYFTHSRNVYKNPNLAQLSGIPLTEQARIILLGYINLAI